MKDVPHFHAADRRAWRAWLAEHHATETGVWLVYDKGSGRSITWEEIVQEALCFGWVDSVAGTVSETQSKIYVSRRKPGSTWSRINKAHVEALRAAGLMTPAGQEAVDRAKANGAWDALNRSDNLEIPPDLQALLDAEPTAAANFAAFPPSTKRNILQWIYSAKRDETRQRRVSETVRLAAENVRAR